MKSDRIGAPPPKQRVLFVGSFASPKGSSIQGGQLSACRAIIASELSNMVEWILLDSTMESLPPPPLPRRARLAAARLRRFLILLLSEKIDAVIVFSASEFSLFEKGLMVIIARIWRKRVVFCPRSGYLVREFRQSALVRWWTRLVANCSDIVVCQGRAWREFFMSVTDLPRARLPIIYNIVEDGNFDPAPRLDRSEAVQALLIGWVERNKGIFDLVAVVERFRPEMAGMKFVICGNGSDFFELKSEVARLRLEDFFELRGWVDSAGKKMALAQSDICLMLSHHEGMPNALLESMAAGRPVIATTVGAVADVVEEGRTGFLCEPGDIDEIGFRILDLRRNQQLREEMGARGFAAVRALSGSEFVWRQWLAALQPAEPEMKSGPMAK